MRSPALENVCAEVRVACDKAHGEVCGHPSHESVLLVHDHWYAPRQLQLNGCGRKRVVSRLLLLRQYCSKRHQNVRVRY